MGLQEAGGYTTPELENSSVPVPSAVPAMARDFNAPAEDPAKETSIEQLSGAQELEDQEYPPTIEITGTTLGGVSIQLEAERVEPTGRFTQPYGASIENDSAMADLMLQFPGRGYRRAELQSVLEGDNMRVQMRKVQTFLARLASNPGYFGQLYLATTSQRWGDYFALIAPQTDEETANSAAQMDWESRGNCRGKDPTIFDADSPDKWAGVLACRRCLVSAECLVGSLAMGDFAKHSIYAGLTPPQRSYLKRIERESGTDVAHVRAGQLQFKAFQKAEKMRREGLIPSAEAS